jgi:PadR family transcriptional regulator PadR
MRVTIAVASVLRAFLDEPQQARYGYELMKQTGFPSGKLYPILDRLEKAGWLDRTREAIDPVAQGRPARVLYRMTPTGVRTGHIELAHLSEQFRPSPRPFGQGTVVPVAGAR